MQRYRQKNTIIGLIYRYFGLFPLLVIWMIGNVWADDLVEEKIKAAFAYNFARYTTWPDHAFADPSSPVELLVYGDKTTREAFAELHQKPIGKRKLVVRFTESAENVHMIFFGKTVSRSQLTQALAAVEGKPVLTIGEQQNFIRIGGAINMFDHNNRFYFEIRPKTAERQGLKLSSRLLKLAILVEN